jgi:hypothetical protein
MEPRRLSKVSCIKLTLNHGDHEGSSWRFGDHLGTTKAHRGVIEAHPGVAEAHPGAVEAHPGAVEASPGVAEAHPGSQGGGSHWSIGYSCGSGTHLIS